MVFTLHPPDVGIGFLLCGDRLRPSRRRLAQRLSQPEEIFRRQVKLQLDRSSPRQTIRAFNPSHIIAFTRGNPHPPCRHSARNVTEPGTREPGKSARNGGQA
jgi:hypothetical protein